MGMAQSKSSSAKGLDNPPYTMKSILGGTFDENHIAYQSSGKLKTKQLLLPFQDKKTWKLLTNTLSDADAQPKISPAPKGQPVFKKYPEELQYLQSLFKTLGNTGGGSKFCQWLHVIRSHGTSSVAASMDISKIGTKCTLTPQQNAEQIYSTFFNETLPFMKRLILSMPQIFGVKSADDDTSGDPPDNEQKMDIDPDADGNEPAEQKAEDSTVSVGFLNPDSNGQCSLSRGQIASILSCCFFGVELYAHCSFAVELSTVGTPGKMEMWVRYFDYVRRKGMESSWFNDEKVTVWRRSLTAEQCADLEHEALCKNETVLCDFNVFDEGAIEDQPGQIHADFANQYIGGGVLEGGNVQEEIRFTVNTECLISKWLCPLPMQINEAILIFGSQQFFNYSGYGSRFSFDGYRHVEEEMFFCKERPERLGSSVISGIDAVHFFEPQNQIRVDYMMREIAKSYVGFSVENKHIGHAMDTVSTGNWGCGIFRGDPQLKAVLQWISVTLSGRKVAYYTFGDRKVANGKLKNFMEAIAPQKVTVGALWRVLSNPQFEKAYRKRDLTVIDLLSTQFGINEEEE